MAGINVHVNQSRKMALEKESSPGAVTMTISLLRGQHAAF